MSVYASIAHDFSRYARIAEGRIIQVAKASRESRGFLFTDSELDDLCSMEVLFAAFGVFMALPPPYLRQTLAMDLSLDSIMKKRCVDYRIYCDLRERCSEQIVYKALPERFSK
jgi:hypothetical protein